MRTRPSPLSLLLPRIDVAHHRLPAVCGIDVLVLHAHANFLRRVRPQQPLEQQMLHQHAHEDAAIAAVLLLWRVVHVDKPEPLLQQLFELGGGVAGLAIVAGGQRVVVEGDAVDDGDEEERPVRPAFGVRDVAAVVYGEEDVRCAGEVGEGALERARVLGVLEQEGHGGAEEDNLRFRVVFELFALEVSGCVSWVGADGGEAYSCQNAMACGCGLVLGLEGRVGGVHCL
jgi:hypothetical protein